MTGAPVVHYVQQGETVCGAKVSNREQWTVHDRCVTCTRCANVMKQRQAEAVHRRVAHGKGKPQGD